MLTKRDDPLIGKLFSSATQKEISYGELLNKMVAVDIIYLGENHDNAGQHQHQLRIIEDLIKNGKKPRLGFEFFSTDQTGSLMSYVAQKKWKHPGQSDSKGEEQLRSNLGWQNRTDESWQFYFAFINLALKNNLTVFGADLPRGIIKRITQKGVGHLTNIEKSFLKPSGFLDNAYRELMFAKFKNAHCGFAHQKMMEKMYETWLERNDAMAHSIITMFNEAPDQPIVVILGKGHVEHNMAVFGQVKSLQNNIRQLNLGFFEISLTPSDLVDYFPVETVAGKPFLPSHEFVWFTQRSSYEDPCARFEKMLRSMKKIKPDA